MKTSRVNGMVTRYLARIDAGLPTKRDAAALRDLQRRHIMAVPFENLAVHAREPVRLTTDALLEKIVARRRGGICYELNGAFGALLTSLGFPVRYLAARVYHNGVLGLPFGHVALAVDAPRPWLVDVGFCEEAVAPVPLEGPIDPAALHQLRPAGDGDVDLYAGDRPIYPLEPRSRALVDFAMGCWWHQTSPDSRFTRSLVCSRATPTGRLTLAGERLIETVAGRRTEHRLTDDVAVLRAYREHFGIALDTVPVPLPAALGLPGAVERP